MQTGRYRQLSAVHLSGSSRFHGTPGFLLWHRIFTFEFENMLRSLGPKFECVTVPFWDPTLDVTSSRGQQG